MREPKAKRVFLASYFTEAKELFLEYVRDLGDDRRVTFIPTAANPDAYKGHVFSDLKTLEDCGFQASTLDISAADAETVAREINSRPFVFVSGGNTFYLLQEMKKKGVDALLRDYIDRGGAYLGSSAGSVVMARDIGYVAKMDDASAAPELKDFRGIGYVDFYVLPHYRSEPFSEVAEEIFREYRDSLNLWTLTNRQALALEGGAFALKDADA